MEVRVCPICDKKMKYAHFCTNCRTYIKEPMYWNKVYNLNGEGSESTIVNQCENHDHRKENMTGKVRSDYNTPTYKTYSTEVRNNINGKQRQAVKKKNTFLVVILVYIMIQIFISILATLLRIFTRF